MRRWWIAWIRTSAVVADAQELKLETNTVVMFLSDNGSSGEEAGGRMASQLAGPKSSYMNVGPGWAWAHNTPFRLYKTWVHEGGIATPFIVRWPGVVKPNTMTHQVGHIIDVLPTCLELAGAKYPREFKGNAILPVDGRSLLPVFRGREVPRPICCSGSRTATAPCVKASGSWSGTWSSNAGNCTISKPTGRKRRTWWRSSRGR
jgi:arylsulfatase